MAYGWIDVMASGHVFVRGRAEPQDGSLPCYEAATELEARKLVVFSCPLSRVRGESHVIPGFVEDDLESMGRAKQHFERYARLLAEARGRRETMGPR